MRDDGHLRYNRSTAIHDGRHLLQMSKIFVCQRLFAMRLCLPNLHAACRRPRQGALAIKATAQRREYLNPSPRAWPKTRHDHFYWHDNACGRKWPRLLMADRILPCFNCVVMSNSMISASGRPSVTVIYGDNLFSLMAIAQCGRSLRHDGMAWGGLFGKIRTSGGSSTDLPPSRYRQCAASAN